MTNKFVGGNTIGSGTRYTKGHKEQIRFRDRYTCQICGVPEAECRRKLDIHHIDYDKENLSHRNLISLCHSCHTKTNFNRDKWRAFFEQHLSTYK